MLQGTFVFNSFIINKKNNHKLHHHDEDVQSNRSRDPNFELKQTTGEH